MTRAVLAALDPPTPGMVRRGTEAVYDAGHEPPTDNVMAVAFSAMLAAAREGS